MLLLSLSGVLLAQDDPGMFRRVNHLTIKSRKVEVAAAILTNSLYSPK